MGSPNIYRQGAEPFHLRTLRRTSTGKGWIALIVAARRRWQLATCVGATASIMAFSVLLVGGLSYRELSAWDVGYWSWSGSMVLLTCAALLVAASPEQKGHRPN